VLLVACARRIRLQRVAVTGVSHDLVTCPLERGPRGVTADALGQSAQHGMSPKTSRVRCGVCGAGGACGGGVRQGGRVEGVYGDTKLMQVV
jgi:hypothetical protein